MCRHSPGRFCLLRFGPLVYRMSLARLGKHVSYEAFRSNSADMVARQDITAATDRAASFIRQQTSAGKVTLVDSHAVSKEHYGWRGVPDSADLLHRFSYSWIVQLYVSAELILERTREHRDGRLAATPEEVAVLQQLQMTVSVYYAGQLGCALHVVRNDGLIEETIQAILSLLG
ncbi:MAG: hypothetical protein GEV03_23965 [Streptosporangiales bacterium]|nr:hypothetical protein [Streptosporangiales bacterium]